MISIRKTLGLILGLATACGVLAAPVVTVATNQVDGHLQLVGQQDTVFLATEVPLESGTGISTIEWNMGAGTSVLSLSWCPESGSGGPDLLSAIPLATSLSWAGQDWHKLQLDSPVGPPEGRVWLVLELQPLLDGSDHDGMSGIGYTAEHSSRGVLCGDASGNWGRLSGVSLAVETSNESLLPGSMAKSGGDEKIAGTAESGTLVTAYRGAFPNPSMGDTTIRFSLAEPRTVNLVVYDVRGRRVHSTNPELFRVGEHSISWGGVAPDGGRVASGVYYARLDGLGFPVSQRILIVR